MSFKILHCTLKLQLCTLFFYHLWKKDTTGTQNSITKIQQNNISCFPRMWNTSHTGALLSPPPPKLEKKFSTVGIFKISPIIGVPCNDWDIIGKNWPNRYTNPYSWQIIPIIPHRIITRTIPPKKLMMPISIKEFKASAIWVWQAK